MADGRHFENCCVTIFPWKLADFDEIVRAEAVWNWDEKFLTKIQKLWTVAILTRSQAVAGIADRTAKNCRVTWPRPRPLPGKIICAPASHSRYKAAYQTWSL